MNARTPSKSFTIKDILGSVFRKKYLVLIICAIGVIGTFIGLQLKTPLYKAEVKMYIKGQSQIIGPAYLGIGSRNIRRTQTEIVKSYPVLSRVVKALNLQNLPFDYEKNFSSNIKKVLLNFLPEPEYDDLENLSIEEQNEIKLRNAVTNLKKNINADLLPGTDIFVITVTDYSYERAEVIANVLSRSYTIFDQEQQLAELTLKYGSFHPSVIQLKDNIAMATKNLHGRRVSTIEAIGTASVKIIEQAVSDKLPIGKPKILILLISIFVSLSVGIAIAVLFDMYFSNTFRVPEDIVKHLNIPVIGTIPRKKMRDKAHIIDSDHNSQYWEFYEEMAEQLYVFMRTQGLKVVIIASAVQHNSNSYIASNACYFLSSVLGHKVLMIDGNLKDPVINNLFEIKNNSGLTNVIEGEDFYNNINDAGPNLTLLPTAETSLKPAELRKKLNDSKIFNEISESYEIVIIDCTKLENLHDIDIFSDLVDGVLLVFNEGKGRTQVIISKIAQLKNHMKIIGGIFNNRTFPIPKIIYNRL